MEKKRERKYVLVLLAVLLPLVSLYAASETQVRASKSLSLQQILKPVEKNEGLVGSSGGKMTVTGSGTIHFLQVFFYSDTACTALLGSASAIDNTTGISFSSGQNVVIDSSSVYQLASNQLIATGNIACMRLYVNGGSESPNGISCQSFTDETCSGTTCTSSQTKSVTWGSSPTSCGLQYMFTASSNDVNGCVVSPADGTLQNCSPNSGYSGPQGMAVSNYVYVTQNTVYVCLNSFTSLTSCTTTGSALNSPRGIAINNGYAYIANQGDNVTLCSVSNTDGTLSSCGYTGSGFLAPVAVAINSGYAYVANYLGGSISSCAVNSSTGALSSCVSTGSGFNTPNGIAINNSYAYVTNLNSREIVKCTITAGALDSCGIAVSATYDPNAITINNGYAYVSSAGSNIYQYAINSSSGALTAVGSISSYAIGMAASPIVRYFYVANSNGSTISLCTLNPQTGTIFGCGDSGGSGFSTPNAIAITNAYAYVANKVDETVSVCKVNASTGALSSGCNLVSGFGNPTSVAVNKNFAFVTNNSTNSVSVCTISPTDGTLSSCGSVGVVGGLSAPNGIVINNGFAYISYASGVMRCTVDASTGAFSNCSTDTTGIYYGMVISNGYAYLTSGTNVYKCTVNSSTGSLTSCGTTATTFTNAQGIIINNSYAFISDLGASTQKITRCTVSSSNGSLSSCTVMTNATGFSNPRGMAIF